MTLWSGGPPAAGTGLSPAVCADQTIPRSPQRYRALPPACAGMPSEMSHRFLEPWCNAPVGWSRTRRAKAAAAAGISAGAAHRGRLFLWRRQQTLALRLLALELADAADCFAAFPRQPLRRLFVEAFALHLAKDAFALQSPLQYPQRLIDIVVTNKYLQNLIPSVAKPMQDS